MTGRRLLGPPREQRLRAKVDDLRADRDQARGEVVRLKERLGIPSSVCVWCGRPGRSGECWEHRGLSRLDRGER